jgi:hypothetical protein
MEKKFNEIGTNILQRITSPWFFTFIPWWIVFNYDFLLRVFGKFGTVNNINKYYCGAENFKYSILGCVKLNQEGWLKLWYSPLEWTMNNLPILPKFIIPFGLTVVSLKFISKFVTKQENHYYANTMGSLPTLIKKSERISKQVQEMQERYQNQKDEYTKIQEDMIDKEMEKVKQKMELDFKYLDRRMEDLKNQK